MANRQSMNSDIDDAILSDVPGFEDNTDTDVDIGNEIDTDGNDDTQQQQVADTDTDDTDLETQSQDASQRGKKPADDKAKKPGEEDNKPKFDKDGNVIDAKGNIIAARGRERRLDEQNRRMRGITERQTQEITKLKQDMASINYLNGAPKKLGLTFEETAAAMDMMGMFKQNPAQLVQIVLAEAAARGVDLNRLLGSQIGAIQTNAISKMLDQRLKPLDDARQQNERHARAEQAAQDRYDRFLASYPDAELHQDAIANLMAEGKAQDEREGYYMVREFALRNGLDFSQPLGPQVAAKIQQQRTQGGKQPANQQQRRPMVTGPSVPQRQMTQRETRIASPDRSYASIVEEAMNEAGLQ